MPQELTFTFPLQEGLHARPATALRERALAHGVPCEWVNLRTGQRAAMDSLLGLLGTETRQGDPCAIQASGTGAAAALADLDGFLRGGFLACEAPEPPAPAGTPQGPGTALAALLARAGTPWWQGAPVAPGIGLGGVRFAASRRPPPPTAPAGPPATEWRSLRTALDRLATALRLEAAQAGRNATQRAVLEAHLAMLQDPEWVAAMAAAVQQNGRSAVEAAHAAAQAAAQALRAAAVPKLRERALDLEDLGDRLVAELTGAAPHPEDLELTAPTILLAPDLTPSRFLALDRALLRGLVLTQGGGTSHTAILARSFGIPCVTAGASLGDALRAGQPLLLDGDRALVIPDPSPALLGYYQVEIEAREARSRSAAMAARTPAATADGHPLTLRANILAAREVPSSRAAGAEGIGLFRTEMLFLDRPAAPTEADQYEAYLEVLQAAEGRPVVLRLLDVGGDKPLPYLPLAAETNPFLGCRGVRWYAQQPELILTQLRAALRAAPAGDLRLMVPMVAELEELRSVRSLLARAEASLAADGLAFCAEVPLGIMVEVPAAAFNLEALAREAAFLCVGSNDLVQYLFAADRGDPRVAKASHAWHPATVRTLAQIATAARSAGLPLSLCGEMAGDLRLLPLLVGLGFQELSMAPAALGPVKAALATLDAGRCRALAARALQAGTAAEVEAMLGDATPPAPPQPLLEPALVILDGNCRTKEEAIKLLVERLSLQGRTRQPDLLEEALWAREATYATGIGHGIAIPHCKSPAASTGSMAILRLQDPLDWGALDGQPVSLVVLLAMGGLDAGDAHLRVFARLARKLADPGFREALHTAPTAPALIDLLNTNVLALS